MKIILVAGFIIFILITSIWMPSVSSISPVNEKKVIILYKSDTTEQDEDDLEQIGAEVRYVYDGIRGIAATIDEDDLDDIELDDDVEAVFEDLRVYAFLSNSVPQINADQVHLAGVIGSGVRVCIVDTGIDDSHPDINPLVAENDFVNNDPDATDDNGHGTHVAGIVASTDFTNRGVAHGSSLLAAKVLDAAGSGWSSDVIAGIDWCVANGADIISMSLGGGTYPSSCDFEPIASASNNAVNQGSVVLAASGNNGYTNAIAAPACASQVIAVGGVDKNDGRTPYSNEGIELDVVAPGGIISDKIVSTKLGGGFTGKYGTSMATPHASATAALVLETDPTLTPTEVRTILRDTAVDLGTPGFDTIYGYGRVNAYAAYQSVIPASPPDTTAPTVTITDPADNTIVSGTVNISATAADNIGVTSVEFIDGVTSIGTDTNPPYNISWSTDTVSNGPHTLTATATDAAGNSASDTITVTVDNIVPPPTESATVSIIDGYDEKNAKTLEEDGKTYLVQLSDNDWSETEFGYYTSYEFSDISIPNGATITSVVIYVEHYEEEGFPTGNLQWSIGTGCPSTPDVCHSIPPPVHQGEQNESIDSWDVTSFVSSPEDVNSLELRVENNDNVEETKTLVDYISVEVSWSTGPPPSPNTPPVLAPIGPQTVDELILLSFTATAIDADIPANTLTFSLSAGIGAVPAGASITSAGLFTWTPTEAQGPGTFTFDVVVSDGVLSDSETITVTVNEVNVAPVLSPIGNQVVDEETLLSFTATAIDADIPANTLTFSLSAGIGAVPAGASITSAGLFTWTPTEAQGPGTFTFDVVVSDGVLSDSETITVTVNEVNVAPVAVNDDTATVSAPSVLTTAEDTSLGIATSELLSNDSDPDNVSLSVTAVDATSANGGTVSLAGTTITYTPASNFNGDDTFHYTVSDGSLTDTATVTVTVTPVNDAPIADAQSVTTTENTPVAITLTGSDVEGDALTFSIVIGPSPGMLSGLNPSTGTLTYTPASNFVGMDSFTFKVNDGPLDSNIATVSITVNQIPINNRPVANAGLNQTVISGALVTLDGSGSDPDGDLITFSWSQTSGPPITLSNPTSDKPTFTAPSVTVSANLSFDLVVNDGKEDSVPDTVIITVNPAPSQPPIESVLTVVDGFDKKNEATLNAEGKTYVVQSSDDDWWETEFGYYTSYEFSDISLPTGATLVKVEIFVEHYEEEEFGSNKLDWVVGTLVYNPTIRAGESSEGEESFPVTSLFVSNPEQLNSLELRIINNDNISEKKTLVDNIYAIVSWTP